MTYVTFPLDVTKDGLNIRSVNGKRPPRLRNRQRLVWQPLLT